MIILVYDCFLYLVLALLCVASDVFVAFVVMSEQAHICRKANER